MNEKYTWGTIEQQPTFILDTNYNITFHSNYKQVGVLDFNGPEMTFTGDMDESAKLFFDWIAASFKERLEQERAKENEACAQIADKAEPYNAADLIRKRMKK